MNEHGDGWFDAERAICIDEMEKAAGSEKHGDLVELYNSTFYGCEDSGVGEHAFASAMGTVRSQNWAVRPRTFGTGMSIGGSKERREAPVEGHREG